MTRSRTKDTAEKLEKCPTGIHGLDELTEGGLRQGRPTLICGSTGSGKTLLAMEFLVRGITQFNEPGVFMTFEETAEELIRNVASLGFNVQKMIDQKKMSIDHVHVERSEIQETGEYDLEGLFVRLNSAIDEVGAKRVVLDTVEALFSGLPNESILRAELRRLFRWLKNKGVTAIITGEQGENTLTRHGIEEYVSDCVIFLDHRIKNQIATRRLRIVKYRGSSHGTNEYPTLIDKKGLSVLPISSLGLNYPVTTERVSTGIPALDAMLEGKGYFRGASVLISGTAGTGKTSVAAAFTDGVCRWGEKCMYFSFEESPQQIIRNMRSIGIDLEKWSKKDLLRFHSVRPTLYGLEMHLAKVHQLVTDFSPAAVVMDPVTNLTDVGENMEIRGMFTRIIDFLKMQKITAIMTSLAKGDNEPETRDIGISSLMDTWLKVRMLETNGERNRLLHILKSRGMAHSNQVREFQLTNNGIKLMDIYLGQGEVFTGSARLIHEAKDRDQVRADLQDSELRQRELRKEQENLQAQADSIAKKLNRIGKELQISKQIEENRQRVIAKDRNNLTHARS